MLFYLRKHITPTPILSIINSIQTIDVTYLETRVREDLHFDLNGTM